MSAPISGQDSRRRARNDVQILIDGGTLYDTLYEKTIFNGVIGLAFTTMWWACASR